MGGTFSLWIERARLEVLAPLVNRREPEPGVRCAFTLSGEGRLAGMVRVVRCRVGIVVVVEVLNEVKRSADSQDRVH